MNVIYQGIIYNISRAIFIKKIGDTKINAQYPYFGEFIFDLDNQITRDVIFKKMADNLDSDISFNIDNFKIEEKRNINGAYKVLFP